MNSAPADPLIGQLLDERYSVRSRIARGGMAMVYLGDDLRLGRRVAIKIMHPHLAEDENFTRRFEQEARSAAGLGHPNVVNVFDQGEANGVPYLVMEYLPGITLRELLKQQRRLTPDQAGEISDAILSGLAAAHEAGIVHRDLKPENVLLADDGRIKIGDFGLARAVSANTASGQALLGTIAYLSPELVTRRIADARSDLYAFGILLFEMLTGQQPYAGEQPMQIAYQHAHSDVPLPSSVSPDVPPEFDQLVRWSTGRDPDTRPAHAREALEYLRAIRLDPYGATSVLPSMTTSFDSPTPSTTVLSNSQQQSLIPSGQPSQASSSPLAAVARAQHKGVKRKRRGVVLSIAVILLMVFGGAAGWWWGQGPGSLVAVPTVAGLDPAAAQQVLEAHTLIAEPFECASLTVAEGLAARTEPEEGVRVARNSTVRLCTSTGPQLLAVPQLIGLSLDEAKQEIEKAHFVFGEVTEERFGDEDRGTVVLAIDPDGNELPETYPEQSTINLIISAGSLPNLSDNTVEQATEILVTLGLNVDSSLNTSEHHDEIAEGRVIGLVLPNEITRRGDTVGLKISLGKPLVEVPDVRGMKLRDAIEALEALGLVPLVPDALPESSWDRAEVDKGNKAMDPEPGTMVPKGTVIKIKEIKFRII